MRFIAQILLLLLLLLLDVCVCMYYRKAKRCYEKAFELDRQSPDAGKGLVQVLMKLSEKVCYCPFLCPSVCLSCPSTDSSSGEIETAGFPIC